MVSTRENIESVQELVLGSKIAQVHRSVHEITPPVYDK